MVCGVPFAILSRRATDKAMKTDNATFGHWATVMPPFRRLTNIQRTIRRNFEEPPSYALVASGVVTITPPRVAHNQSGTVSPA